jgi:uncharacterized protein (DUF1330 family)
MLGSPRPGMV